MTASMPQARRRRRWPWVVVSGIVVIALLAVAGELIARAVLPDTVRKLVIDALDLPADQQIDVEASGILLPQLVSGRLDELRLSSERIELGGITAAADVRAAGVPLRGGEIAVAEGTIRLDEAEFGALVDLAELPIDRVSLDEPNVSVSGQVSIFGQSIPLGLTITPGAEGGELLLTPVAVSIGDRTVELDAIGSLLRESPLLGDIGTQLTQTHRVCIADRLPAGIALTALRVDGTHVVADVSVDGRIGEDERLLENGTC